jgi:hypothetical protein
MGRRGKRGPVMRHLVIRFLLSVEGLLSLESAYQRLHELSRGLLQFGLLILLRSALVEARRLLIGHVSPDGCGRRVGLPG